MTCNGECHVCSCDTNDFMLESDPTHIGIAYKFDENLYLKELSEYIDDTYSGHYSKNKFQTTEIVIERGRGTGFCMGNIDKYSNRYGKKGKPEDHRKDLMKILHFAIIQLYIHDNNKG